MAAHDRKLGLHVFAAVLKRQVAPDIEAAAIAQLAGVEQYAAADPCNAVTVRSAAAQTERLLNMEQVGCAMQVVAFPLGSAGRDILRLDLTHPEFNLLLAGPAVVNIAQPMQRRCRQSRSAVPA